MSSAQPPKKEPERSNPAPSSVPIGVRTHAVVSGRWVIAAVATALGLAALVFVVAPGWFKPSPNVQPRVPAASQPAQSPGSTASTPAPVTPRAGNPEETVRLRLLAEEAAGRFRDLSAAWEKKRAPEWASQDWAAAQERAGEAAAAAATGDYKRAVERYDDAAHKLTAMAVQADAAFGSALAAGAAAIEARSAMDAVKAFQLALAIRPEDPKARHGLTRAERLDAVMARHAAGEAQEQAGALAMARREYAQALGMDPEFAPAKASLARVDRRLAAQRFDELMTRGLGQLERSDWIGAERSFGAALNIRPGHAAAADGLARAKESLQRDRLAGLQREGRALEASERWTDALAAYRRAEAVDPTVAFARDGIARADRMIALHGQLDAYLAEPERLYSTAVQSEAQHFLARLEAEPDAGPRLTRERQRLATALKRATTKITVRLSSDNATEVMLYRVGRLGRFQDRSVELTPGTYTLVGSRPGYKDVRVELIVSPEADSPSVVVACKEPV